jgi:hypothetical protein
MKWKIKNDPNHQPDDVCTINKWGFNGICRREYCLVGGILTPSEKYEFVSWDDYSPNHQSVVVGTNQH